MSHPPNPIEQQRLATRFENTAKFALEANRRTVEVGADIAKEKTQYFEKLALAAGGTIALVVSFVGAHAARLQPPWLLRSALVTLVLAMIAAMYRNWKYPFYVLAASACQEYVAKLAKERCRRDCIIGLPATVSLQDGQPIEVPAFLREFAENEKLLNARITEFQKQEHSTFSIVKGVERFTLFLMVTGMVLLIALAWKNF